MGMYDEICLLRRYLLEVSWRGLIEKLVREIS